MERLQEKKLQIFIKDDLICQISVSQNKWNTLTVKEVRRSLNFDKTINDCTFFKDISGEEIKDEKNIKATNIITNLEEANEQEP